MSDAGGGTPSPTDPALQLPPDAFWENLEAYERVLVQVRETLYEGSWDRVLADLRARLDGKPYVYKLSQTIARDVAAIERMRAYERARGVDLAAWLKAPGT